MLLSDLIGRPYGLPCNPPHSFDCWELVRFVRDTFYGLDDPVEVRRRLPGLMPDYVREWLPMWRPLALAEAKAGDVVLMDERHVGVLTELGVLHACREAGCVRASRPAVIARAFRTVRWLRY